MVGAPDAARRNFGRRECRRDTGAGLEDDADETGQRDPSVRETRQAVVGGWIRALGDAPRRHRAGHSKIRRLGRFRMKPKGTHDREKTRERKRRAREPGPSQRMKHL